VPLLRGRVREHAADAVRRGVEQCALRAAAVGRHGRAVQVDPIKPMLKPPGTKHLELRYDKLHSSFAFKFNLRRYTTAYSTGTEQEVAAAGTIVAVGPDLADVARHVVDTSVLTLFACFK